MKIRILFLAIMVIGAAPASGVLVSVEAPAEVDFGQQFIIWVAGYLSDSCWSLQGHECLDPVDQEIVIEISTYDCEGQGCSGCLPFIAEFDVFCGYTLPSGGLYSVRVVEIRDSVYSPDNLELTTEIEVIGPVSSDSISWASLKCIYR